MRANMSWAGRLNSLYILLDRPPAYPHLLSNPAQAMSFRPELAHPLNRPLIDRWPREALPLLSSLDNSPTFAIRRGTAVTVAAGKPAPHFGAPSLVNNPG